MIRTANLIDSISRKAGGLHESVRRLVQSLTTVGVGVHVMAVRDEFTEQDLDVWKPVPIDIFPPTWPRYFGYSPGFLSVLDHYRPDLVHSHGIWLYPSIATAAYCTRRRVPYMISPHGMVDPWAVRNGRWKKVIAYAIYEGNHLRGARCIRALCESEARSIRQMGIRNPVAVIPNGIDLPAPGAERKIGFPPWAEVIEPGRKVLLFLSRIHPKKGLENLIRAWAASDRSEGWALAISGWEQEKHEAELKAICDQLGVVWAEVKNAEQGEGLSLHRSSPQRVAVMFLGPQFGEAKAACYRHCDAFVLPSFSEGLPMVVLEAWAYAKPVLMTTECNLPEGFAAGAARQIGTTVEGIREGLEALFSSDEAALTEMGARGRQLAADRFAWNRIATQVQTTYEWMLGGGSKPACFLDG